MIKEQTLIKQDTTENWNKAINFIPKENEIIKYIDMTPAGIKIGNGKNKLNELPFINQNFYSVDGTTLILNSDIFEKEG